LAADRRIYFARRLDAFDNGDLAALPHFAPDFRQLDIDNVAQLTGGEFGNTDSRDVTVDAHPLVLICVSRFAHLYPRWLLLSCACSGAARKAWRQRAPPKACRPPQDR